MKHIKNDDRKNGKFIKNKTDVPDEKLEQTGNDKKVFISIKNLQNNFECFSDWTKVEMNKFWKFNQQIHQKTWTDVYATANKGEDKRGLAYTVMPHKLYEHISFIKALSPDITLFELRVDDEIRVHGFRDKTVFYICLLDREHKISK